MNSKDYEYLVSRLEDEIDRVDSYSKKFFEEGNMQQYNLAKDVMSHHEEVVKFIKKIDKER